MKNDSDLFYDTILDTPSFNTPSLLYIDNDNDSVRTFDADNNDNYVSLKVYDNYDNYDTVYNLNFDTTFDTTSTPTPPPATPLSIVASVSTTPSPFYLSPSFCDRIFQPTPIIILHCSRIVYQFPGGGL